MSAVLEVANLSKRFGGISAVDDVSFEVREGEILGIIGPNGSGKSTLFNCVLGQLTPSAGEVRLDGKLTTGMRPCDLNRLGVSRTFQLLQVFPQLSVRENLILAGQEHQGSMYSRLIGRSDAGLGDAADQLIAFFRLSHLSGERAGALSYGQQKLLDAAMAFMAGPRLVLLDEPAGGVNLTMLGLLRERLHAERQSFVNERLSDMPGLSAEDRQRVARMTEDLLERILEEPAKRLRHTRELRQRLEETEALRRLFGLNDEPGEES